MQSSISTVNVVDDASMIELNFLSLPDAPSSLKTVTPLVLLRSICALTMVSKVTRTSPVGTEDREMNHSLKAVDTFEHLP